LEDHKELRGIYSRGGNMTPRPRLLATWDSYTFNHKSQISKVPGTLLQGKGTGPAYSHYYCRSKWGLSGHLHVLRLSALLFLASPTLDLPVVLFSSGVFPQASRTASLLQVISSGRIPSSTHAGIGSSSPFKFRRQRGTGQSSYFTSGHATVMIPYAATPTYLGRLYPSVRFSTPSSSCAATNFEVVGARSHHRWILDPPLDAQLRLHLPHNQNMMPAVVPGGSLAVATRCMPTAQATAQADDAAAGTVQHPYSRRTSSRRPLFPVRRNCLQTSWSPDSVPRLDLQFLRLQAEFPVSYGLLPIPGRQLLLSSLLVLFHPVALRLGLLYSVVYSTAVAIILDKLELPLQCTTTLLVVSVLPYFLVSPRALVPEVFFSPDQLLAQKAAPRGHLTSPRPRLTGQRALTTTATSGLACALPMFVCRGVSASRSASFEDRRGWACAWWLKKLLSEQSRHLSH
ncbi:hypothetical protein KCU88_g219, partial [Aureobasidium melanogenum]